MTPQTTPISEAGQQDAERAEIRDYLTKLYASYLKDRKSRILGSGGFFGLTAVVAYRFFRKMESLDASMGLMIGAALLACGAVAMGLAWLIFQYPAVRRLCLILGGIMMALSLIAYAFVIGLVPGSIEYTVMNHTDMRTVLIAALAASAVCLVFFVPAGATMMKNVHPPTEDDVEARLVMLNAQRQKAAELAASGAMSASQFVRNRRRRR